MAQYEYALRDGDMVCIKDLTELDRPDTFICPDCSEELIMNLFRTRNEAHFSHKSDSICAGGNGGGGDESELHNTYKNELFFRLKQKLSKNEPYNLTKRCYCDRHVSVDILDDCAELFLEKQLTEGYKPDITIKGKNADTIIEIVNTHKIDAFGLTHIKNENIRTVVINVTQPAKHELKEKGIIPSSIIDMHNCDAWSKCDECERKKRLAERERELENERRRKREEVERILEKENRLKAERERREKLRQMELEIKQREEREKIESEKRRIEEEKARNEALRIADIKRKQAEEQEKIDKIEREKARIEHERAMKIIAEREAEVYKLNEPIRKLKEAHRLEMLRMDEEKKAERIELDKVRREEIKKQIEEEMNKNIPAKWCDIGYRKCTSCPYNGLCSHTLKE